MYEIDSKKNITIVGAKNTRTHKIENSWKRIQSLLKWLHSIDQDGIYTKNYSITAMTQTPMACLPWIIRTHFLIPRKFFQNLKKTNI